MFYISMLRNYIGDPLYVVDYDDIEVSENVTSKERPVRILNHSVEKLRNKDIAMVKVQRKHHDENEVSWKVEADMRTKYLELFQD